MPVTSDTEALIGDSCSPPRRPWGAAWGRAAKLVVGTAVAVLICAGVATGTRRGRSFLTKADSSAGPVEPKVASEALDFKELYGTPTYECYDELSNWRFSWSQHKKQWCCMHEHQGCEGGMHGYGHHYAARPFDCTASHGNWQAAWSEPKKNYCCNMHNLGCVSLWEAHKTLWIGLVSALAFLLVLAIAVFLYRRYKVPPPMPPKPKPAPPSRSCPFPLCFATTTGPEHAVVTKK